MIRLSPGQAWLLICAGTVLLLAVWAAADIGIDRLTRRRQR